MKHIFSGVYDVFGMRLSDKAFFIVKHPGNREFKINICRIEAIDKHDNWYFTKQQFYLPTRNYTHKLKSYSEQNSYKW